MNEPPGTPPVPAAVRRARGAAATWAERPAAERAARLRALQRLLARSASRVVETVTEETGRLPADVVMAEVLHACTSLGWLARHAPGVLAPRRVSPWPALGARAWVEQRPRGVAGVIAAGNYPFLLPLLPTATALAAGCAVVLKPAETAPRSGRLVAELAAEAGLPAGVVQLVCGGADVGAAVASADVDVLSVVGSTATGRAVARIAAERLVPVISELGGKDALVVLVGADLRRAARTAVWGACFNAGRSCVSVERVIVIDALFDAYVDALLDAVRDVTVATRDHRDIGPLGGAEDAERITGQLADAVGRGARVLAGGGVVQRNGRWYAEPTVLTDVAPESRVLHEETLGPVLPLVRAADEAAAVAAANTGDYALGASVWAGDRMAAVRVARRLRAGAVAINDVAVPYAVPGLPFGGSGASGFGRQGGAEGLLAYCAPQAFTAARLRTAPREPQWFPRLLGPAGWSRVTRLLYGGRGTG